MTILHMLAVRDRVSDSFQNLLCVPNIPAAIRAFSSEVNRASADNLLYMHADDMELYHLGEFDQDTGRIQLLDAPRQVALAKDLKRTAETRQLDVVQELQS